MTITREEYFDRFECSDKSKQVLSEITHHGRWTVTYRKVWKEGDKYFETIYHSPATECQESYGDITIREVVPFEKTVTDYKPA